MRSAPLVVGLTASLALVGSAYSGEARGRAVGTWSAATSIFAAAGPLLSGWLIAHGSWRAVFALNVPFAVAVLVAISIRVGETRAAGVQRIDLGGAALASTGLGATIYGIVAVGEGCAARRVERNHEHVTLATRQLGQAFQLRFLDQSPAMRRIFCLCAKLLDFRIRGSPAKCKQGSPASCRNEHAQPRHHQVPHERSDQPISPDMGELGLAA